jgi:transposase
VILPAYAPELNPVERLRLHLREHHWSSRTYPDRDALEDAASDRWRSVRLHPEKVKTTCRCEYLTGN